MRNILLVEPNYKNKYPPIGLMKIATYHRMLGDKVTFFKGHLKDFIVDLIAKKCIQKLEKIEETIVWNVYYDSIKKYIEFGKQINLEQIPLDKSRYKILLNSAIQESKKFYQKKEYEKEPMFDRVYVATLFTFYWEITVNTINFAKKLVKDVSELKVGGVAATLLCNDIINETGVKPILGLLNKPKMLDKNNSIIIDRLPLDYSILEEIDYRYPENDAYYGYMTRGCIRKCSFCAVPNLEPEYCDYISMKQKIKNTKLKFGEKRNLLLLDNNVLASPRFPEIIQEIIDCGFGKGATYIEQNQYDIALKNLSDGINDAAYINKLFSLYSLLLNRLKGQIQQDFYNFLDVNLLLNKKTITKEVLLKTASEISDLYTKYIHRLPRQRYIDFNQGVDARLLNSEKAHLLGKINIRPLRVAFDNIKGRKHYENAIRLSAKEGIKNFSNYLLYNFNDKPIELYERLKINVELCEELDINIYSFPMKFHPITGKDRFTRNYLGKHWNRKYIRAIQAILNSIKGKVGRGKEFFYKAFGESEDQFFKILEMPETFILYRYFFEWLGNIKNYSVSTNSWWNCWQDTFSLLSEKEKEDLLEIIHKNKFSPFVFQNTNPKFSKLLNFYINFKEDIMIHETELYNLKKEYDKNPTWKLRRKKNN